MDLLRVRQDMNLNASVKNNGAAVFKTNCFTKGTWDHSKWENRRFLWVMEDETEIIHHRFLNLLGKVAQNTVGHIPGAWKLSVKQCRLGMSLINVLIHLLDQYGPSFSWLNKWVFFHPFPAIF